MAAGPDSPRFGRRAPGTGAGMLVTKIQPAQWKPGWSFATLHSKLEGRAHRLLMPTSISKLTEQNVSVPQRQDALRAYAVEQGWRPSDEIAYYPDTEAVANGHLLVEHGLDNTAVITFLRSDFPFTQLDWAMQHRLLAISYNNLVDWHLFTDRNGVLKVYNRSKPFVHEYLSVHQSTQTYGGL